MLDVGTAGTWWDLMQSRRVGQSQGPAGFGGPHKLHKSRASGIKFAKSRKLSGRRGGAKAALLLEIPRKVVGQT